jgi:coenzyme F420-reducing hydrogenase delta subunit
MRRFMLMRRMLTQMCVEPAPVQLVWASAAEGVRLAHEIKKMVNQVRALGPLNWPDVAKENGAGQPVSMPVEEVAA